MRSPLDDDHGILQRGCSRAVNQRPSLDYQDRVLHRAAGREQRQHNGQRKKAQERSAGLRGSETMGAGLLCLAWLHLRCFAALLEV